MKIIESLIDKIRDAAGSLFPRLQKKTPEARINARINELHELQFKLSGVRPDARPLRRSDPFDRPGGQ